MTMVDASRSYDYAYPAAAQPGYPPVNEFQRQDSSYPPYDGTWNINGTDQNHYHPSLADNPHSYEAYQARQQQQQPMMMMKEGFHPGPPYDDSQQLDTHRHHQPYPFTVQPAAQAGHHSHPPYPPADFNDPMIANDPVEKKVQRISDEWRRRLYWIVPLAILAIAAVIVFEVYKKDFERWCRPLADWLQARKAWSWVIPVGILVVLSFPPLFGHEIVYIVVGLTYPLGVGIGIACAGAIIGEAACFVVFKYGFSGYVHRKIQKSVKWASIARVTQEAGFRGVLLIRYSIIPPHLANPIFATTGMSFFLYNLTVFLSLPKTIIFVALGNPNNSGKHGVTIAKVIAFGVVAIVTLIGTWWIRKKMKIATAEIEAERAAELKEAQIEGANADKFGKGTSTNQNTYQYQNAHSYPNAQSQYGNPRYDETNGYGR